MKRFKFTLQAVQTVRERASNAALEEYARALKGRSQAEAALASAEQALTQHLAEWRGKMAKSFSPGDMLQNEHMRSMLEVRRNESAKTLRIAAEAANKALSALQLARQKSEVVERFHERQRRDFNLAMLKEEQNILDELAISRYDSEFLTKGAVHA